MQTIRLLLIIVLLLAGCSAVELRNSGPPGVAVWTLEDLTADPRFAYAGELLSAQITDTLGKKGKYTVVERARLMRILEEQNLSVSSLADRQTQLRLGELVGARYMLFGGYQLLGGKMRMDVRLVDVETGRISRAVKREVASTELQDWLDAARSAAEEF